MSRKQRKASSDIHTRVGTLGAELLGLTPPFSASPSRGNEHFLYINKGDNFIGVGFGATYSARKFLDVLLQDDEVTLTRGVSGRKDTVISSTDISVRSDNIMDIVNYEYQGRESEWELNLSGNSGSVAQAEQFRSSTGVRIEKRVEPTAEKGTERVRKEKPAKINREGLITIAQISNDLKMESREARSILRKMKVDKPEAGWAWKNSEVDEIKKIIKNNRE